MIYYIEFYEVSSVSGVDFPQYGFKRIFYSEAIKIMNIWIEGSGDHVGMPDRIIPKIITNDTYLSRTFREVYSYIEFRKWCGMKLEIKDDRDYFTNSPHYIEDKLGEEIFKKFTDIVNGEYDYITMDKGFEDDIGYDGEGNAYLASNPRCYDRGWMEEDYSTLRSKDKDLVKEEEEAPLLYAWWNSLEYDWKFIFVGSSVSFANYLPSARMLKRFLNMETLEISGQGHLKSSNTLKTFFQELDLTPLNRLTNLRNLEISHVRDLRNIESIKNLKHLEILKIKNSDISSLNFLEDSFQLKELDITSTKVVDLLPLYPLNNLSKLRLDYTNVTRLTPLKNLKELSTKGTKLSEKDILDYEKLIGYKIESVNEKSNIVSSLKIRVF